MKRFLYILIPLLFFVNSTFSGSHVAIAGSSPIDWMEQTTSISGEIIEAFSDDLLLSRKGNQQEKNQKFSPSNCFYSAIVDGNCLLDNIAFQYPYSSCCRQAVCYGLLFLQQLF